MKKSGSLPSGYKYVLMNPFIDTTGVGMNTVNGFVAVLGLVLGALLLLLIVQSVRRAFSRPGPTAAAMQAFSLTTGRVMLFVAVVGTSMFGNAVQGAGGSSGAGVAVVGILALTFQVIAETRWPRQDGAVRVALLRRPSLRETVRIRYLLVAILSGAAVIGTLTLCLFVDPTVGAPGIGALRRASALLVFMLVLGGTAVAQVLRRPMLAGVTAEVDLTLRRVSAQRVLRAVSAACFAFAIALLGNLHDLLTEVGASPLSRALGTFVNLCSLLFGLGVFLLYLAGPNESRLRKSVARALARQP